MNLRYPDVLTAAEEEEEEEEEEKEEEDIFKANRK
jgi:hypothetical protein